MLGLRPISLSSSAKCGRVAEFSWVSVPGETYKSVSPLVKAILAVAAEGERYRLGHYGAITKVRARGNVTGNGNLTILVAENHEGRNTKRSFFLSPPFQKADSAEIGWSVLQVAGRFWVNPDEGSSQDSSRKPIPDSCFVRR